MGIPSICVIFHGHGWVTGRMLTGPGGYGFNFEITTDSRVGGCCNLWIWVGAGLKKRTRAGLCLTLSILHMSPTMYSFWL